MQSTTVVVVFSLLLVLTLTGSVYHWISGYHYPSSEAFFFEMNTLNDLYEVFFLVPLGALGVWLFLRGNPWGAILIAGVAANGVYNYAMWVTGRQNLWIFVWTAKLALTGTAVALVWYFLPALSSTAPRTPARFIATYLGIILLLFAFQMGQRLWGSATGRAIAMTMTESGKLDWGEPFLRDPIVFFALLVPFLIAAVIGLLFNAGFGGRAAVLTCAFIPGIVSAILFTGPLREYLETKTVSTPMWGMSVMLVIVALPAIASLLWLVRNSHQS